MPLEEVIIYFPATILPDVARACRRLCPILDINKRTLPRLTSNKQGIPNLRVFVGQTKHTLFERPQMPQTRALFASGMMDTSLAALFVPHQLSTEIKIESRMPHPDTGHIAPFWGITTPWNMRRSSSVLVDVQPSQSDETNFLHTFQIYDAQTTQANLPEVVMLQATTAQGSYLELQNYFDCVADVSQPNPYLKLVRIDPKEWEENYRRLTRQLTLPDWIMSLKERQQKQAAEKQRNFAYSAKAKAKSSSSSARGFSCPVPTRCAR